MCIYVLYDDLAEVLLKRIVIKQQRQLKHRQKNVYALVASS